MLEAAYVGNRATNVEVNQDLNVVGMSCSRVARFSTLIA